MARRETVSFIETAVQPLEAGNLTVMTALPTLTLSIRSVVAEADGIVGIELVDPEGRDLEPFTAGAHIDVHVADGIVRQYSLCNDPTEHHRYVIAVLNDPASRGGSRALHRTARPGGRLTVSVPRNHFKLNAGATRHLLLAGGIGVTPMMAMAATLEAEGADWHMHYCTRSPEKTAFLGRLRPLAAAGKVQFHHDGGDPARGLDLKSVLQDYQPGTHLYYCGPPGFMAAAAQAAVHWPAEAVHFEYFSPPADRPAVPARVNTPFQVKIASTGDVFDVPADRTIIQVLRQNGFSVDTSCEDGFCGTCLTKYVAGEPEHRDSVLDDDDRKDFVLICCARSKTPVLVLDL
jgi:vanillate O-demethylase ferredoxin subunit